MKPREISAAILATWFHAKALPLVNRGSKQLEKILDGWLGQTVTQALSGDKDRQRLTVLVTCFFLIFVWACLAPVDRIVRAEGRIIAAAHSQIVQHLEGGIVTEILVREGQAVQAGDILMRLSDVQANTSVQQGQSKLWALKAQQARLTAEVEGLSTPKFEAEIPSEYQQLEINAFKERSARMQSEKSALTQLVTQRRSELAETQSRVSSLATELELAKKQSALMEGLYKKGAASQMEMLDAQGRMQRLATQYNDSAGSIPRLQAAVNEASARLDEAHAKTRADIRTELSQVSSEIAKFSLAVDGDEDRLARTEVRAPATGFVNRLHFNTIGGVVKPGEPLLEITPNDGPVAVEARVRPDDRASLRPGLDTRILIGAYDYAIYGALDGKVIEVSADTLPDDHGQRYYRVVIQTQAAKGLLAQQAILPGMTARADVVLGQRSVISYLISPLTRFKANALHEPS
jgi:adhesin transport system membrane fusion protein